MIPPELRALPQWVVWRYEERDGKRTKVPYKAARPHEHAKSDDRGTWSSYETAEPVRDVDGVGFVFAAEDPFCGIDFDGCVEGEDINPHVANLMRTLDSYSEFSPSGAGLHVIIRATLNSGRRRTSKTPWGAEFENYDRERFFCFTGRHIPGTPRTINERQAQLEQVRAKMFPVKETPQPAPTVTIAGDDRERLELARRAKNGANFDALYAGRHSYRSASQADQALANLLSFWFGPDPANIDRAFRGSGLMRDKWDERRGDSTYGAITIEKALEGRTEFYEGPRNSRPAPAPDHSEPAEEGKGGSTRASMIKMRRIRWAWKGRLACGYLSIQSGESSLGKSTQVCSTIANLTHGRLEGHLEGKPTRALIVASEDAREDVWVPRLTVAGADLELVEFQNQTREWNLRDGIKLTERVLENIDAKLVFVDSIFEHMPPTKSGESIHSTDFIRRALGPFADLCKARQVTGLISTHPPKAKGSTFADMVIASVAFIQVCRVGLLFAWHPDDLELPDQERRRVLMRPPGGSNIGRDPGSFEFRVLAKELLIEDELEEVPYTTPLEPSDVTFRDVTRTPREDRPARSKIADAKTIIDERLADGAWHPSMINELIKRGFSKSTAYEAAKPYEKAKEESEDGKWWWAAPGTPKSSFVELDQNFGSSTPRAWANTGGSELRPKPPDNGSTERCSEVPGEMDETTEEEPVDVEVPKPDACPRAHARTREGTLAEQAVASLGEDGQKK